MLGVESKDKTEAGVGDEWGYWWLQSVLLVEAANQHSESLLTADLVLFPNVVCSWVSFAAIGKAL